MISINWEMFYTTSKKDEERVDQVSIDVANKRYVLEINAKDEVTDGYDEFGEEINSVFVSRFVFDLIINGLKNSGFKEVKLNKK